MKANQLVRRVHLVAALAAVLALFGWGAGSAAAAPANAGAVFTLNNSAQANAVVAFTRAGDGTLTPLGSFATGGRGTGAGLGSQGALALSDDHRWLFAVNAGSSEISSFAVARGGLRLVGRVGSGGNTPISLTLRDDLLYVLNAGNAQSGSAANITGFSVDEGQLTPLAGSTQALSQANPGPAQVQFNPDGDTLVVTEKGTNTIDTFALDGDGLAMPAISAASAGPTPFGFAFDRQRGQLFVSEAASGAAGAGSVSSYTVEPDGISVISGAVANHQGAPCWAIVSRNGRFLYIANTGSATITGYRIGRAGQITLLSPDGVTAMAGSKPADLALSRDSSFLYVLNGGDGTVGAYAVAKDGGLTALGASGGLPAGTAGLAAY